MNAEYKFQAPSPFQNVKLDDSHLNLTREKSRLENEADHCILSLRTEIINIDADYQKNIFVRVLRFGMYLMLAAAIMSFWTIKHTVFFVAVAAEIGLILLNVAVWLRYRNRKAQRTLFWNARKSEIEDKIRTVTIELAKTDQHR